MKKGVYLGAWAWADQNQEAGASQAGSSRTSVAGTAVAGAGCFAAGVDCTVVAWGVGWRGGLGEGPGFLPREVEALHLTLQYPTRSLYYLFNSFPQHCS